MMDCKKVIEFSAPPVAVRLVWNGTEEEERASQRQFAERRSYERGWAEGRRAVQDQFDTERADLLALQRGVFESLNQCLPEVKRECEQALAGLALETARKLVAGLPISPAMVEAAIDEAMAAVDEQTEHHVYLNSADLELLQQINSPLLMSDVGGYRTQFHPTSGVTRGGCLVRTRFGVIDGQRETKMELMEKSVML